MKKVIAILLTVFTVLSLAGCSNTVVLYKKVNFKKIVKLGDYKGITVDTTSKDYEAVYQNVVDSDVKNNNLYTKRKDGYVAEGDAVNIDYVGRIDGNTFEGGTGSDYMLTIGSNTFIDGFESGLIGTAVGSTVDLKLTFPEKYKQSPDLAGKPVVFTVTVNYVQTAEGLDPSAFYSKLGYKSLDAYEADANRRALDNYVEDLIVADSKLKEYPETEKKILLEAYKDTLKANLKNSYDVDLETYLKSNNMTEEELDKKLIKNTIEPLMDYQIPLYAIFKAEGMKVTSNDIDLKIDELIEQSGNPALDHNLVKEQYGAYYFEYLIVKDKVIDFVIENADLID